jgi:L-threonylcarbamoyladenylate synthase
VADSAAPMHVTSLLPYGPAAIAEAAAEILAGRPVAIPTETVYGLAADATSGEAVAGIYAAKGRPSFNPLIVHVAILADARKIATFDAVAELLAARFWPGPLTLVLPLLPGAPIASLATAGLPTVALRVPAHPAMQDLLAATGRPLAAPSANASGAISPTRAGHVLRSLGGRIPLIIDAGPTGLGLESTIVAPAADGLRLLRPGPITIEMLTQASGAPLLTQDHGIEAPGQLPGHYAPSKPLRLNAMMAEEDECLIGFGSVTSRLSLSPDGNLIEAAARLFDLLHQADSSDAPSIAVAPIPEEGIGQAINDRLRRASFGAPGPSAP